MQNKLTPLNLQKQGEQTAVEILFAHNDEPLPAEFLAYAKPQTDNARPLADHQIRKWKSRRLAQFLLIQLAEKYGIERQHFSQIKRTKSGRPYITDERVDFNISHSGDWVAVIFSVSSGQKKAVGVDLEHPQKTRRYLDLLNYYASPQEISEIQTATLLPELATLSSRFYLSWCLREAILKSQGVGIVKLAEVAHSLAQQTIHSAHCPTGKLAFHFDLPFYFAYFFEQSPTMLSLPRLAQWKNGQAVEITDTSPIIYQVNPNAKIKS